MMGIIETLDDALLRRRDEVTTAVADSFRSSVRAIIVSKDGSQAEIVGSCILLCIDNQHFAVTAAHVLDNLDTHAIYIAGTVGTQPVQLLGHAHLTTAPGGLRSKDKIDIGFWELDSSMVKKLGAVSFVDEAKLSHNKALSEHRLYLAMGYPVSKNKKNVDSVNKTIKTSLAKYTGELNVSRQIPATYAVSGAQHLFLKYQKFSETVDGEKRKSFEPVGLSGGPLLDIGNFASPQTYIAGSVVQGYLAGMIIERIRAHNVLVATRIQVIVDAIRTRGPRESAL